MTDETLPTNDIPVGSYCYHGSRNPNDKNYRPCPYWGFEDKHYVCKYLNRKESEKVSIFLFDQVKIGGCPVGYEGEEDVSMNGWNTKDWDGRSVDSNKIIIGKE